jgi:hypothetical protein
MKNIYKSILIFFILILIIIFFINLFSPNSQLNFFKQTNPPKQMSSILDDAFLFVDSTINNKKSIASSILDDAFLLVDSTINNKKSIASTELKPIDSNGVSYYGWFKITNSNPAMLYNSWIRPFKRGTGYDTSPSIFFSENEIKFTLEVFYTTSQKKTGYQPTKSSTAVDIKLNEWYQYVSTINEDSEFIYYKVYINTKLYASTNIKKSSFILKLDVINKYPIELHGDSNISLSKWYMLNRVMTADEITRIYKDTPV